MTMTLNDIQLRAQRALARRLTEKMDERHISARTLAKAAGIPRSTLQNWLTHRESVHDQAATR